MSFILKKPLPMPQDQEAPRVSFQQEQRSIFDRIDDSFVSDLQGNIQALPLENLNDVLQELQDTIVDQDVLPTQVIADNQNNQEIVQESQENIIDDGLDVDIVEEDISEDDVQPIIPEVQDEDEIPVRRTNAFVPSSSVTQISESIENIAGDGSIISGKTKFIIALVLMAIIYYKPALLGLSVKALWWTLKTIVTFVLKMAFKVTWFTLRELVTLTFTIVCKVVEVGARGTWGLAKGIVGNTLYAGYYVGSSLIKMPFSILSRVVSG